MLSIWSRRILIASRRAGVLGGMVSGMLGVAACSGHLPKGQYPVDTTVPLHTSARHSWVEVMVNGAPARFLVDTGASHNVVSQALADRLSLQRSSTPGLGTQGQEHVQDQGQGPAGAYPAYAVGISTLAVGQAQQRDAAALVVPLPPEPQIDGLLGAPFLQAYVLHWNFTAGTLRIQSPQGFAPPAGSTVLPLQWRDNTLSVAASVAGHAGQCQIDTGANNAITVLRPAADRWGLRDAYAPRIRGIVGEGVGGVLVGDMVRLPALQLGPFHFAHVVTELSLASQGFFASEDYACNLGADIWQRFDMTLDYPGLRLVLQPNARYNDAFDYPRTGFTMALRGGSYQVLDVVPGSPADHAGVQAGDVVATLNGQPTTAWTAQQRADAVRQRVGTPLQLGVRSASGVLRNVTLVLQDLL